MSNPSLSNFLSGKPLAYKSSGDGKIYAAVWRPPQIWLVTQGREPIACELPSGEDGCRAFYHAAMKEKTMDVPDDLTIPTFLKRKSSKENDARVAELTKQAQNPERYLKMADPEKVKAAIAAKRKPMTVEAKEKLRVHKERKPKRPSRDGLVTIADIAKELGIDAKDARGALRTHKVLKPDCGWAWADKTDKDKAEIERIKRIIKSAIDAAKAEEEPEKKPAKKKK